MTAPQPTRTKLGTARATTTTTTTTTTDRYHTELRARRHQAQPDGRPDRDRARAPSPRAATTAAPRRVAESSAAPIAHHQKKANTDATSKPNPRPATRAPARASQGRRVSAASNARRRRQRPPASSAVPASKGASATTSTSDNPCPGLIGIRTGPSRPAGTTNSSNASANRIPHPTSHLITAEAYGFRMCRRVDVPGLDRPGRPLRELLVGVLDPDNGDPFPPRLLAVFGRFPSVVMRPPRHPGARPSRVRGSTARTPWPR
jgi:hypothetical protein